MSEHPQSNQTSRILGRHGSFNIVANNPLRDFSDVTHALLTMSWARFFAVILLGFVLLNAVFAGAYLLVPNGVTGLAPGAFLDAFAFSVQTVSTIGYGAMSPTSPAAHALVAIESLTGLLGVGLVTGLFFAKFARPTARVMFSNVAVVRPRDGVPTLQWRLANERGNRIVDARMSVVLAYRHETNEGEVMRTFIPLPLVRDHSPVFALSWTAMHVLDESSPMHGWTQDDMAAVFGELVITISGVDDTFNQPIHAQWSYVADEVLWNHGFADIIVRLPDGRRTVDYDRFHETRPLGLDGSMPGDGTRSGA